MCTVDSFDEATSSARCAVSVSGGELQVWIKPENLLETLPDEFAHAAQEGRRAAEEQGPSSAAEAPAPREEEPPADFICPITTELMSDPVMAADGHSYERSAIKRWLATKSTSPMTGEALVHSFLAPNHTLRRQIREWQQAA
ncbi:hypothetical protein EMIHUDRAFT_219298 [Emiliania huxleyi CCMP1516]|uniref:U-box domain-containing protein n=2 Tax=Emiliania huxleyi TaxID=2903 RepID=A0A0D3I572_EMIH1|nr:hypothetical protein EMIHUDRAFT_219298 [Emiliania huxleyi CCMP1516]EOD06407.1 hypothetical protein EMIHUDRAFT_219298 [Emiliania huxleyi CCMP1516]|eukprot:XP_005758836.1 hypothetical protein EMIHUDRAFT_219298 [Emiliania huxleyi CCMP1516]